MLAHGDGLINAWGFAYTGGVVGAIVTALWLVHHDVARSPRTERVGASVGRLPRWLVLVGLVCGISLGFGGSRLIDRTLQDTPDPLDVATRLCDAAANQPDELVNVHSDLEHVVNDLGSPDLERAHTSLDVALADRGDSNTIRAAVAEVVRQLERVVGSEDAAACVMDPK